MKRLFLKQKQDGDEPVCAHKMMQYAAYNKGQTHRSAPTIVSNLPPQRAINLPPGFAVLPLQTRGRVFWFLFYSSSSLLRGGVTQ